MGKGQRILVTGGQGFIGRHLAALWLTAEPDATVLAVGRSPRDDDWFPHDFQWGARRVRAPVPADLGRALRSPRYAYEAMDMSSRPAVEAMLRQFRPDRIVHLVAALRDSPVARLVDSNIGATMALLDSLVATRLPVERVVLGSTGGIHGAVDPSDLPIHEDTPCRPTDPYSVSKLSAELLARAVATREGLPVLWARIFNPIGCGQDERHVTTRVALAVAEMRAGTAPPVLKLGALDTTRDFIDVRDVAAALRLLALRGTPDVAYNVASGLETPIRAVVDGLLEAGGLAGKVQVVEGPRRVGDLPRHVANIDRLRGLGWMPQHSLADSLAAVCRYACDEVAHAASDVSALHDSESPSRLSVRVEAVHGYDIEVSPGLLDRLASRVAAYTPSRRAAVLTDDQVHALYGDRVVAGLRAAGLDTCEIIIPAGEKAKSREQAWSVIARLHAAGFDRRSVLVNLGGGVITDLGGFVAAQYMRGVAYVNVPTTLLAQNDSAIGGKVAVNAPWTKNFVGAFHQPRGVYIDPTVLATLDRRNLAAGAAEAIKVGICADPALFERLESGAEAVLVRRDPRRLGEIVRLAAAAKVRLLAPDPFEVDLKRVLNLGHTFGHSLETAAGYGELLHGEAVGFGIAVAAAIALRRGMCSVATAERIFATLDAYGLPPRVPRNRLEQAAEHFEHVRMVRAGQLWYVLPTEIGRVEIVPELGPNDIDHALDDLARHPLLGRCIAGPEVVPTEASAEVCP